MESNKKGQDILFKSKYKINFQLNPVEYGYDLNLVDKSEIDLANYNVTEFYREPLAATSVSLGHIPSTHQKVAIKKIFKERLIDDFLKTQAAQEFPLHCSLNHENIVKGLEWSENEKEYILVMECTNHPDYFKEKIDVNLTPIKNEVKLKSFANDILEGLTYLHSKGVIHGDIKLENLLLHVDKEKDENSVTHVVKMCDFGLSRIMNPETRSVYMETPVGSHHYMAPEIKSRSNVNEKVDMWALGIVLYKMAVAYKPTQIAGYKYGKEPIPFRKVDWRKRSHEIQDLILRMLEIDPEKRISAEEALQHPWFQV